jgi:hypothetical protein
MVGLQRFAPSAPTQDADLAPDVPAADPIFRVFGRIAAYPARAFSATHVGATNPGPAGGTPAATENHMTALKTAAAVSLLTAALLGGAAQAEAATAQQISSQGRGVFTTSKGLPVNFIGDAYEQPQADGRTQDPNRIRDFEHHNRYFGGN